MKIRHFLLGAAIVALMASCGSKQAAETVTETVAEQAQVEQVVETPAEEVAEQPTEQATTPAATTTKKTIAKKQANVKETKPAVDPCEATVKKFEKWVEQLQEAKKKKSNGGAELKAYALLAKQATEMKASVASCKNNPEYRMRVGNAIIAANNAL